MQSTKKPACVGQATAGASAQAPGSGEFSDRAIKGAQRRVAGLAGDLKQQAVRKAECRRGLEVAEGGKHHLGVLDGQLAVIRDLAVHDTQCGVASCALGYRYPRLPARTLAV